LFSPLAAANGEGYQQQIQAPESQEKSGKNVIKNDTLTIPNPVQVSQNAGIKIDTVPVPYLTAHGPIFDTVPVPYLGLLIKHKHIKHKQERERNALAQKKIVMEIKNKNQVSKPVFLEPVQQQKKDLPAPVPNSVQVDSLPAAATKEPGERPSPAGMKKPFMADVLLFFKQQNYPKGEAGKFFNHYQSNGWLVGGKSPMQDW